MQTIRAIPKAEDAHIYVQCGEDLISALVDSGSWVTVMRKSTFEKLRHKPSMKRTTDPFKGFGNVITRSVGAFDCLLNIDDYSRKSYDEEVN